MKVPLTHLTLKYMILLFVFITLTGRMPILIKKIALNLDLALIDSRLDLNLAYCHSICAQY